MLESPAVVAHARFVLVGGEGARLHEEIITAGGEIVQRRFRRINVSQIESVLDVALDDPVSQKMQDQLKLLWPYLEPALMQSLEARMKDRLDGMRKLLQERKDKEIIYKIN